MANRRTGINPYTSSGNEAQYVVWRLAVVTRRSCQLPLLAVLVAARGRALLRTRVPRRFRLGRETSVLFLGVLGNRRVAHRLPLGGAGLNLRSVRRDSAKLAQRSSLAELQHLAEKRGKRFPTTLTVKQLRRQRPRQQGPEHARRSPGKLRMRPALPPSARYIGEPLPQHGSAHGCRSRGRPSGVAMLLDPLQRVAPDRSCPFAARAAAAPASRTSRHPALPEAATPNIVAMRIPTKPGANCDMKPTVFPI